MKIQSAIANVGGMASVMKVSFLIFCYIFSIIKRDEIILNRLFDFDLNSKSSVGSASSNKANTNKCSKEILKSKNMSQIKLSKSRSTIKSNNSRIYANLDYESNNNNHNNGNNGNAKLNNLYSPGIKNSKQTISLNDEISRKVKKTMLLLNRRNIKYNLSFSFIEIIFGFLLCNSCQNKKLKTKRRLYELSKFAVDEFLDVSYIIQKLEEFEKFKLVMLDSQQIALFDFISKELISLDDERLKNHDLTRIKNLNKNKQELAKVIIKYQEKIKAENIDVAATDRKLIELLNEDLKQI